MKTGKLLNTQLYDYIFIRVNKDIFTPFFMVPEFDAQLIKYVEKDISKKSQLMKKIKKNWLNYKQNLPQVKKILWVTEKIPGLTPIHEKLFIDTINGMLELNTQPYYGSAYEFSRKYITPLHIIELFYGIQNPSKIHSELLYVFDEDNNFVILPMINIAFPSIAPGPLMVIKKEKLINMFKSELLRRKNTVMALTLPLSDPFYIITYTSLEASRTLSLFICDDKPKEYITIMDGVVPEPITRVRDSMISLPFNNKYSIVIPDTLTHNKLYMTKKENTIKIVEKTLDSIMFKGQKFIVRGKKLNDSHYVKTNHKMYSERLITKKIRECIEQLLK